MAESGACCPPHRGLPAVADAGAIPFAAYVNPGSGQSGRSTAHTHTDSHTHAEAHRYGLPVANGYADPGSPDGNANPHPNAVSPSTNTHCNADPDPAHRDPSSYGDAQAAHPHTHECLPFSTMPSGSA